MKKIKYNILTILVCIFYSTIISAMDSTSQNIYDSTNTEQITITADNLEYISSQNKIIGKGNVYIEQEQKKLKADEIEYFIDLNKINATGNVNLTEKKVTFSCEKLVYDVKNATGTLENSLIYSDPWYFKTLKAEKIDQDKIKTDYSVTMTTCDKTERPHYNFTANKMTVLLNDKIIAYNVVFHIGKVPFLYLPIYYYSLKYSPFYFAPGYNSKYGFWIKTKMHFTTAPYLYGSFIFDSWERLGYGKGIEYNYYVDENKKGNFYIYGIDQKALYYDTSRGRFYNPPDKDPINRWNSKIFINHELTTNLIAKLNYERYSDPNFKVDFENIYETRLIEDINFTLNLKKDTYSISAFWQDYKYWNAAVNDYLIVYKIMPELKVDFIKKPILNILNKDIYYKLDLLHENRFLKDYNNPYNGIITTDYYYQHAYISQSLMTSFIPFPQTSLSPSFSFIEHWNSNHNPVNINDTYYSVYSTQLQLTTNLTRNLRNEIIHDYTKQLDETKETEYNYYKGVVYNNLRESIIWENNNQTAKFITETNYNLRKKDDEEIKDYRTKFGDLKTTIYYEPIKNLKINSYLYWDIYADENDFYLPEYQSKHKAKFKINDTSIEYDEKFSDQSKFSIVSRYYNVSIDGSRPIDPHIADSYTSLEWKLEYSLTKKWLLKYSDYFRKNLYSTASTNTISTNLQHKEQKIELVRDLHCWEARFSMKQYYITDDFLLQEFWINFILKAFPDQKIEIQEPTPYSSYYNFQ